MRTLEHDELVELEHRGWNSLCESRGGTFYGDLMTPDALMVLVNGMVLDRDTVATSLNDSPPWTSYDLTETRLVDIGADSVALVYKARAVRDQQGDPFIALMSSIYRVVDGRPRLALYQQTAWTTLV